MLWDSIRKNSVHNANVILGANFPVDAPLNPLGMTSLHFAASSSSKELIDVVLSFNPNINVRDSVNNKQINNYRCSVLHCIWHQQMGISWPWIYY